MYHIYDRNLFVCVIPSITITALFGEFVFPCLPFLLSFVTQLQFCSRWLWCVGPNPKPGSQLTITAQLVYSLLLYHGIVCPCEFRQSPGNNAHTKISQYSNSFFLTGKHVHSAVITMAAPPLSDALLVVV